MQNQISLLKLQRGAVGGLPAVSLGGGMISG